MNMNYKLLGSSMLGTINPIHSSIVPKSLCRKSLPILHPVFFLLGIPDVLVSSYHTYKTVRLTMVKLPIGKDRRIPAPKF